MADSKSFYAENSFKKPNLMDGNDCRKWNSDCICTVRMNNKSVKTKKMTSLFEYYNYLTLESKSKLTNRQYLLCPNEMYGFVFRTRTWVRGASLMAVQSNSIMC